VPRSWLGSALFDVSCQPITDLGELARTKPSLHNTHDLERLGFRWAKRPQKTEFFDATDGGIDSSDITNLIVGLADELPDEITQLLPRTHKPG